MRWPWQRRRPIELRDFQDLTGFTLGEGLSSPLTSHAALRRISGWIAIACRPVVDRLAGLTWQAISDSGEELEKSPFVELLRNPNPQQSGGLMLRMVAQTLVLSGLLLSQARRDVVEHLPVLPDARDSRRRHGP